MSEPTHFSDDPELNEQCEQHADDIKEIVTTLIELGQVDLAGRLIYTFINAQRVIHMVGMTKGVEIGRVTND